MGDRDRYFFEKLDVLYNKLLIPFFISALKKHQLTTALDLDIARFKVFSPAGETLFKIREVICIQRHSQEVVYNHALDLSDSYFGSGLYKDIVASYNHPKGFFGRPNFIIDWPTFYGGQLG